MPHISLNTGISPSKMYRTLQMFWRASCPSWLMLLTWTCQFCLYNIKKIRPFLQWKPLWSAFFFHFKVELLKLTSGRCSLVYRQTPATDWNCSCFLLFFSRANTSLCRFLLCLHSKLQSLKKWLNFVLYNVHWKFPSIVFKRQKVLYIWTNI